MAPSPKLSVVMPALNEERNVGTAIQETLNDADALGIAIELLVVDDGSTDGTGDIVRQVGTTDPRVKLMVHPTNRGIGASFWTGVDAARGEFVVMMPGDGENIPREILMYLPLMEHADLVIPYVFNKDARSWVRNRVSYLYQFIINASFAVALNYTNGTVIYRRELLAGLPTRSTGFFFQTEAVIRLVKAGCLFMEAPYRLSTRQAGKSKAINPRNLAAVAREYARLVVDLNLVRRRAIPALWRPGKTQTASRYPEGRKRWKRIKGGGTFGREHD